MLHPFSNGSVCALYLAPHIIRKALFWCFVTLLHWYPQAVVQNWRWLFIKESYISLSADCGSTCLRRFIIPTTRDISFDIFLMWEFQVIFSLIVSPRKSNSSTRSMSISFILIFGISQSRNVLWLKWNNIYLVLETLRDNLLTANQSVTFFHFVVNSPWYWVYCVLLVKRKWDQRTSESSVVRICNKCKLFGNGMHIIDV